MGEFLKRFFDIARKMGIAIVQTPRVLVVGGVAIDHERTGQTLETEHRAGDCRRTALAKTEDAQMACAKQPSITVLSIGAPSGLVSMLDHCARVFGNQSIGLFRTQSMPSMAGMSRFSSASAGLPFGQSIRLDRKFGGRG
jgi:hypothetical protein